MKKPKSCASVILTFAVIIFFPLKISHAAQATANLPVSATVINNCTISTSALAFGTYDPVVAHASASLDGTGAITITCTKGAVTTVGLDLGSNSPAPGTRRMTAGGGNFLDYEIYQDVGRSAVWGNSGLHLLDTGIAPSKAPRSFNAFGRIPAAQDAAAGSYNDTVVATVNF